MSESRTTIVPFPEPDETRLLKEEILKVFTTIPNSFIDDFFDILFKNYRKKFTISLELAIKWLGCRRDSIIDTIRKRYYKDIDYIESVKKKSIGSGGHNRIDIYMTRETFRRICMLTRSPRGETVRTYFIELDDLINRHAAAILKGIKDEANGVAERELKLDAKRTDGPGWIYAFRTREETEEEKRRNANPSTRSIDPAYIRIGQTGRTVEECIREHNSGRMPKITNVAQLKVNNRKAVEDCLKQMMKKKQLGTEEIFEADMQTIKKLMRSCNELCMTIHLDDLKGGKKGDKYYLLFIDDATIEEFTARQREAEAAAKAEAKAKTAEKRKQVRLAAKASTTD